MALGTTMTFEVALTRWAGLMSLARARGFATQESAEEYLRAVAESSGIPESDFCVVRETITREVVQP